MSELKNLGNEILDHLRRYRQVGVRLAANAPRSAPRKPVSTTRRERRRCRREACGDDSQDIAFR